MYAAGGLGNALQLHPLGLGLGMAQLIPLPELIENGFLLHGGGAALLLQPGQLLLGGDYRVVAGLGLAVQGRALLLQVQLLLLEGLQLTAQVLRLPVQVLCPGPVVRDLGLRLGLGLHQLAAQVLPAAAVAGQVLHQLPQVLQAALGALTLGSQGGLLLLAAGDLVGDAAGFRLQFALSGQTLLGLLPQLGGPVLLAPDLLLRSLTPGGAVRRLPGQLLIFRIQCPQRLLQRLPQTIVVLLPGLQCQHLLLCGPVLILGHVQLILGLLQVPAQVLRPAGGLGQRRFQASQLLPQPRQLAGPGQDARAAADAAAGHGAAPVDDLAVQGDDAEPVLIPPRHIHAAVQILHHHGAAQQILENAVVLGIIRHQLGRDAHKAVLLGEPGLPEHVAPDGAHGQEGGPACVPAL